MTAMEMKANLTTATRNNEFELKGEVQRCHDKMQDFEPGDKEYADILEKCYIPLLTIENNINARIDKRREILLKAAALTLAWITYRGLVDTSADPFFREIGKNFIKILHS